MSHRNEHMYMIVCTCNTQISYYAQGIQLVNIPFATSTVLALYKITYRNRKSFQKNLLGPFTQFQRAYRLWLKAHKSPRYLRQRETGMNHAAPHRFVNYYRQTYKPLP